MDSIEPSSKEVPSELLEEVFELNMALEESSEGPEIDAARQKFQTMRDEIDAGLALDFAAWDATHSRDTLAKIRGLLNRRKYITNLIQQTESDVSNRI